MTFSNSPLLRTFVLLFYLAVAAPFTSAVVQAADLPIYTDSLPSGWADWSWISTRNFANSSPVHGGTSSLAVRFDGAWGGLYLHANQAISTSGYSHLRFWINGGAAGNQKLGS